MKKEVIVAVVSAVLTGIVFGVYNHFVVISKNSANTFIEGIVNEHLEKNKADLKGDKGDKGGQGDKGEQGDPGVGIAVGTISAFWGNEAPNGWKICNGEPLPKDTYPELYEHLVKTDSSSKMNDRVARLPNLKGMFLRGLDSDGTIDPDGAKRLIGSLQSDAVGNHIHPRKTDVSGFNGGDAKMHVYRPGYGNPTPTNSEGPSPGGEETRPVNVAVNWIIKY